MTVMEQNAIRFEEVTTGTFGRWKDTPGQQNNAGENVKWAIAFALDRDCYQGFTNRNLERQKAIELGKEGIEFALLYNMIQLGECKRSKIGKSFGIADSFILLVTEACRNHQVNEIQELLEDGVRMLVEDFEAQKNPNGVIQSPPRSGADGIARKFAESVIDSYIWYNTLYKTVSATKLISSVCDREAAERLDIYYRTEQVKRQQTPNNNVK